MCWRFTNQPLNRSRDARAFEYAWLTGRLAELDASDATRSATREGGKTISGWVLTVLLG